MRPAQADPGGGADDFLFVHQHRRVRGRTLARKRRFRHRTAATLSSRSRPTANPGCASYDGASCLWARRWPTSTSRDEAAGLRRPAPAALWRHRVRGPQALVQPRPRRTDGAEAAGDVADACADADTSARRSPTGAARAERLSPDGLVSLGASRRCRLPLPGAMGPRQRWPGQDGRGCLRRPQPRCPALFRCGALARLRTGHAVGQHRLRTRARRRQGGPGSRAELRQRSNPDIRPNVVRAGKFD